MQANRCGAGAPKAPQLAPRAGCRAAGVVADSAQAQGWRAREPSCLLLDGIDKLVQAFSCDCCVYHAAQVHQVALCTERRLQQSCQTRCSFSHLLSLQPSLNIAMQSRVTHGTLTAVADASVHAHGMLCLMHLALVCSGHRACRHSQATAQRDMLQATQPCMRHTCQVPVDVQAMTGIVAKSAVASEIEQPCLSSPCPLDAEPAVGSASGTALQG